MKKLLTGALAALLSFTALAATTVPPSLITPTGSTAGQAIVSTGPSSTPAWGSVTVGGLAAVAANTVLANVTGSSAVPTAFAMPSCSGANNALRWTSGTGFTCASAVALTSGALSQFAATTSTQLLGVISDETGSGALVFGTSPTITTPNIVGITNAANGAAGSVGQCITSNVPSGSAVSLTASTSVNVTSLSLTAGDWMVWGNITFVPAGTTTTSSQGGWTSTTSATNPLPPNNGSYAFVATQPGAGAATNTIPIGQQRINVSSGATLFLTAFAVFATSTETAYGFLSACRWH